MPGFNGMGPQGSGSMTGRGLGHCGGGQGARRGRGCALGYGMGSGNGRGRRGRGRAVGGCAGRGMSPGWGRGPGWLAVGYEGGGTESAGVRAVLEERASVLKAELARTETLLGVNGRESSAEPETGA